MAGLTGSAIKDSYKSLLRVDDDDNGVDPSLTKVTDGEGTDTPLKLSTEKVEIIPPNTDSTTMFEVSQNDGTSILTVDSSNGKVGIGTAAPSDYASNANDLVVHGSGDSGITIVSGTGNDGSIYFADANSGSGEYRGYVWYNHDVDRMYLGSNAELRVTINEDGKVGIGTASPISMLDISGSAYSDPSTPSSDAASISICSYDTTDGDSPSLNFTKSGNATIGQHGVVVDGENLGFIKFWGSDGTNFEPAAGIVCEVDGTPADDATDMPGMLSFWTTSDGSDGLSERITIKSTGNVGIGTASPTAKLHIDQSSTSGAVPVLKLDQGDVDDSFVEFIVCRVLLAPPLSLTISLLPSNAITVSYFPSISVSI